MQNRSDMPAPRGDLPGWRQVFVEEFSTDVALGSWPQQYARTWQTYPNGWPDTAGKGGVASEYRPGRVLSVKNGILDYWLHTENNRTLGAVIIPAAGRSAIYQRYGRYVVRFRADPVPGYKIAFLLWPQSEQWPRDGEIDFPEGNLTATIDAFLHFQNGKSGGDQVHFPTEVTYQDWHTAVIEWTPEAVVFILDDTLIGEVHERIPSTPMRWTLQVEHCLDGCDAPRTAAGHVQIDWVAQYSYNPVTSNTSVVCNLQRDACAR